MRKVCRSYLLVLQFRISVANGFWPLCDVTKDTKASLFFSEKLNLCVLAKICCLRRSCLTRVHNESQGSEDGKIFWFARFLALFFKILQFFFTWQPLMKSPMWSLWPPSWYFSGKMCDSTSFLKHEKCGWSGWQSGKVKWNEEFYLRAFSSHDHLTLDRVQSARTRDGRPHFSCKIHI